MLAADKRSAIRQPEPNDRCSLLPRHRQSLAMTGLGQTYDFGPSRMSVRYHAFGATSGLTAPVKSFGRGRRTKVPDEGTPRATGDGYGDFDLQLMSAIARPPSVSRAMDADRPLRCARGWHQRANTSVIIMRPPQQRHDGRNSSGSSTRGGVIGWRSDVQQFAGEAGLASGANEQAVECA